MSRHTASWAQRAPRPKAVSKGAAAIEPHPSIRGFVPLPRPSTATQDAVCPLLGHFGHSLSSKNTKEHIMEEVFPIAAGAVIGLLVQWVPGPRRRAAVLVLLCLVFGALASFLAGELELSMAFISVDTVLVFFGALLAVSAAALWRRRARATR